MNNSIVRSYSVVIVATNIVTRRTSLCSESDCTYEPINCLLELSLTRDIPDDNMKGTNHCIWLLTGSRTRCEKSSIFEHCKHHHALLRKGSRETVPCHKCGVGTQAEVRLCKPSCAHRVGQKLIDTEKRTHRNFTKMLVELKQAQTSI